MITLVDYGVGNIAAFRTVYKRLKIDVVVAGDVDRLKSATKLILPGVGAFDTAMSLLQRSGMRDTLDELVLGQGVPVLGVCVGMQMLMRGSEEGRLPGLGWIDGNVISFRSRPAHQDLDLPHMGWNHVMPTPGVRLFDQVRPDALFYFLHTYIVECDRPEDIAARTIYGSEFTCAISAKNIHGVQFHPEKSHQSGVTFLGNFAAM